MSVSTAKETILKSIRQALTHPAPVPFPQSEGNTNVFQTSQKELEIEFAENFTGLLGRFSFCENEQELVAQISQLQVSHKLKSIFCNEAVLRNKLLASGFSCNYSTELSACHASITTCESLVARTGSILLSSAAESGRTASVYAPIHICVAYTSQLVYDIKDALQLIKEKYRGKLPSIISLATGPSRTADIEKTLVVGVHGPKEVYVFLVED